MAKAEKSYEKLVLVSALFLALGLGVLAFLKISSFEEKFSASFGGQKKAPKNLAEETVQRALKTFERAPELIQGEDNGRPVNMFTGIPFFVRKGEERPVDLYKDSPVHGSIPNSWWLKYNIDPTFADSPEKDEDGDGFSNSEEFEAQTDPTDSQKYPKLFSKLKLKKLKEDQWLLIFNSQYGENDFVFRLRAIPHGASSLVENRMKGGASVKKGQLFFFNEPYKERFKVIDVNEKEFVNNNTGIRSRKNVATVEDQLEGKKGKRYEIPYGKPRRPVEQTNHDYTAVLFLDAVGEGGKNFEIAEGRAFSLPYDPEAETKPYRFVGVEEGIVVIEEEGKEGERVTRKLKKIEE